MDDQEQDDFEEQLDEELPAEELSESEAMEAAIEGTWQRTEQGLWINSRSFVTKDCVVPQGVVRTLEDAFTLEAARIG